MDERGGEKVCELSNVRVKNVVLFGVSLYMNVVQRNRPGVPRQATEGGGFHFSSCF